MIRPTRILDRLLWHRTLSVREQWIWFWLLVLSPIMLCAGCWLHYKVSERRGLVITASRPTAIRMAREYVHQQGIDLKGWSSAMWIDVDGPLEHYLNIQPADRRVMLGHLVHPVTMHVRFTSPDDQQSAEVLLDEGGHAFGLHRTQPSQQDAAPRNEPASARSMAEETMEDCLGPELPKVQMAHDPEQQHAPSGMDTYTWTAKIPDVPELTLNYTAGVRGLTLLDSSVSGKLDPDYLKKMEPLAGARDIFTIAAVIVTAVLFLFVFVRYVQRVLQGEVSRERMVLVSAFVSSCYILFMVGGDKVLAQARANGGPDTIWPIVFFGGVVMLLIGAAAGVAYSGTEGDLRERYPGKLTSLDALILGRWFSRNVGTSVLLGAVLASWLLVLRAVVDYTLGNQDLSSDLINIVQMVPLSRVPWAMILFSVPTSALLGSLVGLLLPLTFSIRLIPNRRWSIAVFFVLAYIGTCFMAEKTTSTTALAIVGLIRLFAMVGTFFAVDFLACLVMACVLSGVTTAVGLAQMAPFVVPAAWGVWRGRTLSEEQVRPQYAKNLAERQSLQEEVAATREAQARLLPAECPRLPGVTLAATYHAAESVGGDFYDFLPLGPQRIGVLLTEGGQGGLATALSVALTKGYVTQKAGSGASPAEILESLHIALDAAINDGAQLSGVLFAIIDTAQQTLTYARVGPWPRVLAGPESQTPREVSSPLNNQRLMHEATIPLRWGNPVLLYSDGLAAHVKGGIESWWRNQISGRRLIAADELQERLLRDLVGNEDRKAQAVQDDITFILITPTAAQAHAQEQVA